MLLVYIVIYVFIVYVLCARYIVFCDVLFTFLRDHNNYYFPSYHLTSHYIRFKKKCAATINASGTIRSCCARYDRAYHLKWCVSPTSNKIWFGHVNQKKRYIVIARAGYASYIYIYACICTIPPSSLFNTLLLFSLHFNIM